MLETNTTEDARGLRVKLRANIYTEYAEALYRMVLAHRPESVVEIGLGMGVSSLAILTALEEIGGDGRLISLDPFQYKGSFGGCGVRAIEASGLSRRHQFLEEFNYLGLRRVLESGLRIDFGYIDGMHTFDHALLDFWYLDRMLATGGTPRLSP
jgi:predicted O-methyltransferase YrrM